MVIKPSGSGGRVRRGLEGKGPTPPAEARKGHKKNRIANAKAKQVQRRAPVARGRGGKGTSEMVVGRNPVVEALRSRFGDRMRYVFRHAPVEGSEAALRAAELAEYAAETTGARRGQPGAERASEPCS